MKPTKFHTITAWCYSLQAELEGSPDIQVTLTTPPDKPGLDHLVLHPIVHPGDAHQSGPNRKLRFSAPLDFVNLVHYQYAVPSALPIRGFYQMKVSAC